MMSQQSSLPKRYMGGALMRELHGNLNRVSDENWKELLNYYATGTLSLKTESSLLKELTEQQDTSQVLLSLN
jgi:hypothetical protein